MPAAHALGDAVILPFFGAILLAIGFTAIVYRVAARCSRSPGLVAGLYFVMLLAYGVLAATAPWFETIVEAFEGWVRDQFPDVPSHTALGSVIVFLTVSIEVMLPALCVSAVAGYLARHR